MQPVFSKECGNLPPVIRNGPEPFRSEPVDQSSASPRTFPAILRLACWTRRKRRRRVSRTSALDPVTGLCDLYLARPVTCRVFGPPVRSQQGLGVCELCYHGASEEEIAACEMPVDPDGLEAELLQEFEQASGRQGRTLVAFALAGAGTIG
jgi:hypothetical protein